VGGLILVVLDQEADLPQVDSLPKITYKTINGSKILLIMAKKANSTRLT